MTPTRSPARRGTLAAGHDRPTQGGQGAVTGHLLKVIRERIPLTQTQLAERLRVDPTTVQAWESGRRPLAAVSAAHLLTLRRRLLAEGADPASLVLLDVAMDADSVIGYALDEGRSAGEVRDHPLAGWVFNRASTHVIAWALTGTPPAALPPAPAVTPRRRGPSPHSPVLAAPQRRQFFSHMRRSAEIAERIGDAGALLRRQAVYLCSYDTAPDTREWLADIQGRRPLRFNSSAWSPRWADARSLATSLTRYGDLDQLHGFIEHGLSDDSGELANLNYWAYWLGHDALPRSDDSFMADSSAQRWDAGVLLRSLADRLDPELGCIDLNIHSVWSLLANKPGLPTSYPALAGDLRHRVARLLDSGSVSRQARRELDQVHYGLKLSTY
ncbi:helix-turn-helix domain-containing protein [Streptomyces orinoci]|uniref:Helix-turn-helix transcriptional regulator n=1 Tax=Streptomyces orinoci TaxID=67339 RepID=A0ABV3K1N7_STRON|nr:helix-turn-helix transcriptional regulator [Streptomyces orinoci]